MSSRQSQKPPSVTSQPESTPASSTTSPPPLRRSRGGCQECRRLHRKCDEGKPVCGFCQQNSRSCSYQKVLSWGGRPFKSSRFGNYLGRGAVKIPGSSGNPETAQPFIYGTAGSTPSSEASSSRASLAESVSGSLATAEAELPSGAVTRWPSEQSFELSSIPGSPDWLPWLPTQYAGLLDHFARSVVRLFVPSEQTVHETCSAIIPVAVDKQQSFHLLTSILCLASTHRQLVGLEQDDAEIAHWKDLCIQHLQQQFSLPADNTARTTIAATALMLSLCDIVAGGHQPDTWRGHLAGSIAVLDPLALEHGNSDDPYQRQVLRLCKSLQLRAVFSEDTSESDPAAWPKSILKQEGHDFLHEFHGFSTALSLVLEDMQVLIREYRQLVRAQALPAGEGLADTDLITPLFDLMRIRSQRLITRVQQMLRHPITRLDPNLEAFGYPLPWSNEFKSLDEAFHHATLVQLYSRIENLPSGSAAIQEHVSSAIQCFMKIVLRDQACPAVSLLQPIFAIGCEAESDQDRNFIIDVLDRWISMYGRGNALRAREFLQELWRRRDVAFDGQQLHWSDLMHELRWDLSLY